MNTENQNRNKFSDVADVIEDELSQFAIGLVKRKPKEVKDPSRVNLFVVGLAAFLMLTLLDLISAVIVGSMTNPLYGVLVFVIGVGALAIAEVGYFWAYSSKWQKIVSVVDGGLGIVSTLTIGVIAAVLYAVKVFNITDTSGWTGIVEVVTMGLLILVAVTHALLWISYVLIDKGVQMYQNYNQGKATNKMRNDTLKLSEDNMTASLAMANRMLTHARQNKGGLLREEIVNLTGEDLLEGFDYKAAARNNGNGTHPSEPTR